MLHLIFAILWFGLGLWLGITGETTDMLICYAISAIWSATIKK